MQARADHRSRGRERYSTARDYPVEELSVVAPPGAFEPSEL